MHLTLWHIVLLAVVQGVTEFLPVSSDGHLVAVAALLNIPNTERFDVADITIVLHLGTLFSILAFYVHRIARLVTEDRRAIPLLLIGTAPAVAIGLPIKLFAEGILESVVLTGPMLILTGLVLVWGSRSPRGERPYSKLRWYEALWIGTAQAAAIMPGLSRSGTTISTGLRLGLAPASAATFSFLLAIPAIAGAGVLEAISVFSGDVPQTPWSWLLAGTFVSFIVGLCALGWLQRWLEMGRLHYFAWWCIPLGIAVVTWQLVQGL